MLQVKRGEASLRIYSNNIYYISCHLPRVTSELYRVPRTSCYFRMKVSARHERICMIFIMMSPFYVIQRVGMILRVIESFNVILMGITEPHPNVKHYYRMIQVVITSIVLFQECFSRSGDSLQRLIVTESDSKSLKMQFYYGKVDLPLNNSILTQKDSELLTLFEGQKDIKKSENLF